jgi:Predicted membrane protein
MSAPMGISNDIKSAGTLGLVGTVLMLVGLIPHAEILSIVGLILVLIALNKLSKAYNNEAIWRNALYGFVMGIVGAVVLVIAVFAYIIPILTMHALFPSPYGFGLSFLVFFIVLWTIAYVFTILEYRFFRDAYRELARSSGINDFNDAAKWYWYGALLFIIIVGAILILVGDVYALLGYNKLR